MNTIKKLSELAVYLKRAVETYSQRDYEQLHGNFTPAWFSCRPTHCLRRS